MKIAIVGATGEVGRMMISCLEELNLSLERLDLFASAKSAGTLLYYLDQPIEVQELTEASLLKKYDYVFFSAGAGVARTYAPIAADVSELVIDNSSGFRKDDFIPLVVPQINGDLLNAYTGIVANPNCSTIQMVLPLDILDQAFGLKKVVVSTYQAVSGSGRSGVDTLMKQRKGSSLKGAYPEIIDLNVIPQIGVFLDNGYSTEEEKMDFETKKIMRNPGIAVCATTVRVPVIYGHSASIYAEFDSEIDLGHATELLKIADGVRLHENSYITALAIGNSNLSHVCRMRQGVDMKSLCFWNVAHNVRLGAAANAVNIMHLHAKQNGKL